MPSFPESFDPQFHTRVARQGRRSVWLAAPFPVTVLPQKTALYRAWRADESRRLQAQGDIVLNVLNVLNQLQPPQLAAATPEALATECA